MSKYINQALQAMDFVVNKLHLEEFDEVKPLKLVAQKIGFGCRPCHLIVISGFLLLTLFLLEIGSSLLCSFVGFAYPAYKSFKALESTNKDDDVQWLCYWVVFAFATVFDSGLSLILSFLPFYYLIKMGFYIYLFHPKYKGATTIYNSVLKPLLQKYEGEIDSIASKATERVTEAISK